MRKKAMGIGMLSGGLDSALAVKVLQDAGVEVQCVHFFTGFCVTGHHSRVGKTDKPVANNALQVAAELGVPLEMIDISSEYMDIVLHPRYGYGANMNPCIDCRIFMLRKAREYMIAVDADFVFTGEVIGQRPMSQMRRTLDLIEKNAGLKGRLLRPLCAKLLPPTIPEEEGLVDREKLLAVQGRSRRTQLELADKYGLTSYSQPAGGCCFLTDEAYSRKLRDMLSAKGDEGITMDDVYLLGVGRHFRLAPDLKVIIGRDETENNFLARFAKGSWVARAKEFPGPLGLVVGELHPDCKEKIASMVARYCDGKLEEKVAVELRLDDEEQVVEVAPAEDAFLESHRI